MSRLQLLIIKFKNLRIKEYESISDSKVMLCDIAKTSFALEEKLSKGKLAKKILGPFPKRFDMKVITIEEAQDISTIKVDELIGSLQTFEMAVNDRTEKEKQEYFLCIQH